MFPIPWNFPFRKKDGSLGKIEDLGGQYTLPTASADTKGGVKVGSGLTITEEVLSADAQLPEYSTSEAGKALLVDEEGNLEWDNMPKELPSYTSTESGKMLGVTSEGELAWINASGGKIYYKDYTKDIAQDIVLASFVDGSAASSGMHIGWFRDSYDASSVNVEGYTPISAIAEDIYTGYHYSVSLKFSIINGATKYSVDMILGSRQLQSAGLHVRVFYVKNDNLESLNT